MHNDQSKDKKQSPSSCTTTMIQVKVLQSFAKISWRCRCVNLSLFLYGCIASALDRDFLDHISKDMLELIPTSKVTQIIVELKDLIKSPSFSVLSYQVSSDCISRHKASNFNIRVHFLYGEIQLAAFHEYNK